MVISSHRWKARNRQKNLTLLCFIMIKHPPQGVGSCLTYVNCPPDAAGSVFVLVEVEKAIEIQMKRAIKLHSFCFYNFGI
jgi:hypothetical protein